MFFRSGLIVGCISLWLACGSEARACLRAMPDKRAIQWSDTLVRGKLLEVNDATGDELQVEVVQVLQGKLKSGDILRAIDASPTGKPSACQRIDADDRGKLFLLLLRSDGESKFGIVTLAPVDEADPSAAVALKQLIDETRKAESAVTEQNVRSEAVTLANAEDDTEAEHAEAALLEMGPKAGPAIKRVMAETSEAGKKRLQKVIDEIMPPVQNETATTKPVSKQ